MAKPTGTPEVSQHPDNPLVVIKYSPESAPLVLADNTTKMLTRVQSVKSIANAKQLETATEIISAAKITADEVETFIASLRDGIQHACERVRNLKGYEDFEATLTVRKWGLRTMLVDSISRLRGMRAKFLSDEEARTRRENLEAQAKQDKINETAAAKAQQSAIKAGADKGTAAEIRREVLATPAPIVTSRAASVAQDAGVSIRYKYTAKITSLKSFLGFCLNNPVMLATLSAAVPDIEKSFRKMADDQKEAFKYPGIELVKTPVDVERRGS